MRWTHNPLVVGSKPTGPTIKPRDDWRSRGFFIVPGVLFACYKQDQGRLKEIFRRP